MANLEHSLRSYLLKSGNVRAKNIANILPGYKRKYFGFRENQTRYILLVGLCSKYWHPTAASFRSDRRPFTDMGDCYFYVEFDSATGTFRILYIDGEA